MSTETGIHASEPPVPSEAAGAPKSKAKRGALLVILVIALVAAAVWLLRSGKTEDTDDAQMDGHIIPVSSRIEGTIVSVHVDDNQIVQPGEALVDLDAKDYDIAVQQAQAQADQASAQAHAADPNLPIARLSFQTSLATGDADVASAEAGVAAANQDLAAAQARLKEAEAINDREQANFQRYETLFDQHEVSRAEFDQYKASSAAQKQTLAVDQASIESAKRIVDQRQAVLAQSRSKLQQTRGSGPLQVDIRQADIKSSMAATENARANLEKAKLNLSRAHLVAPVAGVVTQRNAEVGSHVGPGQQLLMIVQTDHLWITANFKETQLAHMRPDQRATVYVDALNEKFEGKVESMPAVTGSRTSVLPPENATGNYVKVIQRLPVRIRLNSGQRDLEKLRPGMSVEPKVYTE